MNREPRWKAERVREMDHFTGQMGLYCGQWDPDLRDNQPTLILRDLMKSTHWRTVNDIISCLVRSQLCM